MLFIFYLCRKICYETYFHLFFFTVVSKESVSQDYLNLTKGILQKRRLSLANGEF